MITIDPAQFGATREDVRLTLEAEKQKQRGSQVVVHGMKVDVELPGPGDGRQWNPWLATAGMFQDDLWLEPMLREIYAARDAETPRE